MSKDFDFNRIGKRLPYTTPEGFLDDMEKQVWERVKDEVTPAHVQETFTHLFMYEQVKDEKTETPSKPKRNYRLWYSISGGLVAKQRRSGLSAYRLSGRFIYKLIKETNHEKYF